MPQPCDLLLLRFPFSDVEGAKLRPILVLTPSNSHSDFIGAGHFASLSRLAGPPSGLGLRAGAPPKVSTLRPHKVLTLNKDLVVRRVGD
jgi:mRNA interferase MazF